MSNNAARAMPHRALLSKLERALFGREYSSWGGRVCTKTESATDPMYNVGIANGGSETITDENCLVVKAAMIHFMLDSS